MTNEHTISSGIPGLFYRRPVPTDPPFAEVGDAVEVGQTLGLVEIMKSFHPVVADAPGVITAFLVDDLGEVGPGQALVTLDVTQ